MPVITHGALTELLLHAECSVGICSYQKKRDTVPGLEALRINNTACKQTLQFGVRNAIIQGSLGTRD